MICEYGCGKKVKYQLKNGRWCCSESQNSCSEIRKRMSKVKKGENNYMFGKTHSEETKKKMSEALKGKFLGENNHMFGKILSEETRKKISEAIKGRTYSEETKKKLSEVRKGRTYSEETRKKMSEAKKGENNHMFGKNLSEETKKKISEALKGITHSKEAKKKIGEAKKITIKQIKKKYPFFSQIEEIRYNPDNLKKKEIQIHCKYSECENSKERGGWFTSSKHQLFERIKSLENPVGFGESNFYCSDECKSNCKLFNLRSDPFKEYYKYSREVQPELRELRLEIDNYTCQKCGKTIEEIELHCHHIEGIRWEPLESADIDKVITYCVDCHYAVHQIEGCKYAELQCRQ